MITARILLFVAGLLFAYVAGWYVTSAEHVPAALAGFCCLASIGASLTLSTFRRRQQLRRLGALTSVRAGKSP